MNQEIRNKLRNVVTQCRKLLEDSVSQELEGKYGIFAKKDQVTADPNAPMSHLTEEEQASRKDILDHFAHIKARGFKPKDALDQLVREIAFTHLNRLCAYKMMEAREVYVGGQKFREAVSRGIDSNGVKFYLADHPDEERLFNTGHQDIAYRHFLDWLGGLLSDEIGVLFHPNDPANRLYPRQKTLDEVLDLLNGGGIKLEETDLREAWPKIWSQDETIGWVYQYFTPKELRDQARKESAAPRNSYELAFRNQFFTPRYVVEFLTDNTLGRIWYEMRKGETKLKDQCRYMVRRPTEIFLTEGEQPSKDASNGRDNLSQEELLKLPVHIPHRPKRDPRDLKILDPACGSGHFLLYCFDLLVSIYEEAYVDPQLGPALQEDYPTLDVLRQDVPRLILAHNVHGIDIDLRCSQIAALALWLRCQRAYQQMGLKKERPKITRSNFVCAEPMPGEEEMLKEFVSQLEPKLLGQVVEVVFEKMKLAGEAGSLLKIEEDIRDAVSSAKQQWVREMSQALDRKGQPLLFTEAEIDRIHGKPKQASLFDVSDVTDDQFFERAETEVIKALLQYAEKAHNGHRLQRRLFMEDAVRGFAFVDLCHKRYDVVLMNPPFGDASKPGKGLVDKFYPFSKMDLYAAFVERGVGWLVDEGILGAITSRTGLFLSTLQRWREEILLGVARPVVFADLGNGVLDTAMVETAAYCLEKTVRQSSATFFRHLQSNDKATSLRLAVDDTSHGKRSDDVFDLTPTSFNQVPGTPFAYWVSDQVRRLYAELPSLEGVGRAVRVGLQTSNDERFLRCWWEVAPDSILDGNRCNDWRTDITRFHEWCLGQTRIGKRWVFFPKGGAYSPFFSDIHLVVNWGDDGREMKQFAEAMKNISARGNGPMRDFPLYFHYGLTWSYRTHRLCLQELPAATIISTRGSGVFADRNTLMTWLGLGNSEIVDFLVKIGMGREGHPQFDQGDLKRIPFPQMAATVSESIGELALECLRRRKREACAQEVSPLFIRPVLLEYEGRTLGDRFNKWAECSQEDYTRNVTSQEAIDAFGYAAYGLRKAEIGTTPDALIGVDESTVESTHEGGEGASEGNIPAATLSAATAALVSHLIGIVFGRWDVRRSAPYEVYGQSFC